MINCIIKKFQADKLKLLDYFNFPRNLVHLAQSSGECEPALGPLSAAPDSRTPTAAQQGRNQRDTRATPATRIHHQGRPPASDGGVQQQRPAAASSSGDGRWRRPVGGFERSASGRRQAPRDVGRQTSTAAADEAGGERAARQGVIGPMYPVDRATSSYHTVLS